MNLSGNKNIYLAILCDFLGRCSDPTIKGCEKEPSNHRGESGWMPRLDVITERYLHDLSSTCILPPQKQPTNGTEKKRWDLCVVGISMVGANGYFSKKLATLVADLIDRANKQKPCALDLHQSPRISLLL